MRRVPTFVRRPSQIIRGVSGAAARLSANVHIRVKLPTRRRDSSARHSATSPPSECPTTCAAAMPSASMIARHSSRHLLDRDRPAGRRAAPEAAVVEGDGPEPRREGVGLRGTAIAVDAHALDQQHRVAGTAHVVHEPEPVALDGSHFAVDRVHVNSVSAARGPRNRSRAAPRRGMIARGGPRHADARLDARDKTGWRAALNLRDHY